MNPRDFCLEPSFPVAILACFNFDPLFFERVVLPALRIGGTERVLVLADHGAVTEAAPQWAGQAVQLGRRYLLAVPRSNLAFHPKFMIRLGRNEGRAWFGSGNLTASGWGMNEEIASTWKMGADHDDNGGWLAGLLSSLQAWCRDDVLAHEFLRDVHQQRWWPEEDPSPPILLQGPDRPSLASQLAKRWEGRSFERLRLATGSTDRDGAMLTWARDTFGVAEATVALDPARSALSPKAFEQLPRGGGVVPREGLHAKVYWFDGKDGSAAVAGSANCSAAAWHGHNTECMVVWDSPTRSDFQPVLDRLVGGLPPSQVLREPEEPDPWVSGNPEQTWRVTSVRLDAGLGQLHLLLAPPMVEDTELWIEIDGEWIRLTCLDAGLGRYCAAAPVMLQEAVRTVFCRVGRLDEGAEVWTEPRWIDDVALLSRRTEHRSIATALDGLLHAADHSEQQKVLHDVQLVTDALLDEADRFVDPPPGGGGREPEDRKTGDDEGAAPSLNPDEMVVSLIDELKRPEHTPADVQQWSLPVLGVMAALFGDPESEDDPDATPDDEADANIPLASKTKKARRSAPPPQLRERLREQVDSFFVRFTELDPELRPELKFVSRCRASGLVQAASYPLALVAIGLESGWVDPEDARRWVTATVDLLFHHRLSGVRGAGAGVLARVRHRFAQEGRRDVFDTVVGDGTLWLALCCAVAALTRDRLTGVDAMHDLMVWRVVWAGRTLRSNATPARLAFLLRRLRAQDAQRAFLEHAEEAYSAVCSLERWLTNHGEAEVERQKSMQLQHNRGDPWWGPRPGWAVVVEDTSLGGNKTWAHVYRVGKDVQTKPAGIYANLRIAAEDDAELLRTLKQAGLA